ncbi:MAG: Glu-tRNA(Gln) amidotransferase subunit GatE [Candidatus Micrarchaeia archaeon]
MHMEKNPEYYRQIGFLCGLEIHQRLATKEKLFCSCSAEPAGSDEKHMGEVVRHQRAVAGELGSIDQSTKFEAAKQRSFIYRIYKDHTCLVDIDEEPPHELNMEALEIALEIARALNCTIVDEIEPMRKEVVDGSDPSAFQRTLLIGLDGSLSVDGTEIAIPSIFLEEESCGIESSNENSVVYNTDRLGIPLVEIDTDKYIPTPQAAKELALRIGLILRISNRVQRGIGTIRQDVNVSIKGGARVELKGIQDLDLIDKFVENEITRQQNLIKIAGMLKERNAKVGKPIDVTDIFSNTESPLLRNYTKEKIVAVPMLGFKGLLGYEINPDTRLGTEISEYAKKAGVKGLIHSDEEMAKYKISEKELEALAKRLRLGAYDGFVMIGGGKDIVEKAMSFAILRAELALEGVPEETRIAYDTKLCTTRFQRPLPGGSRMYPETDIRPIQVTKEMLAKAEKEKPDLEKEFDSIKQLVGENLAMQLIKSTKLTTFKFLVSGCSVDPKLIANTLLQHSTELRREGYMVDEISNERLLELLKAFEKGMITKQAIPEVLKKLVSTKASVEKIIEENKLIRIKGEELKKLVEELSKKAGKGNGEELISYIMSKYRLNIDGGELKSMLQL